VAAAGGGGELAPQDVTAGAISASAHIKMV